MMAVAAGAASMGLVAFASSFAMFAAGRAFEQIRNSIGYTHLNVKIGATHGGISVGEDGASHQCCEDFALMRSIPGMVVMSPSDDVEAGRGQGRLCPSGTCVSALRPPGHPCVAREEEDFHFEIGKGEVLRDGTDVAIIATGLMVNEAIEAGKLLEEAGVYPGHQHLHHRPPGRGAGRQASPGVRQGHHLPRNTLWSAAWARRCSLPSARSAPPSAPYRHPERSVRPFRPRRCTAQQFGLSAEHIVEVAKDFCGK